MKWLITLVVALCMVTPAVAGENLFVAVVGNDIQANPFYVSQKLQQFLYDQTTPWESYPRVCYDNYQNPTLFPPVTTNTIVGGVGCEQFGSNGCRDQSEVCLIPPTNYQGERNVKIGAGDAGFFEWYVRLPEEPVGAINLCFQCGVLKPGSNLVNGCAAETGERIVSGTCTSQTVGPGTNPLLIGQLPKITAIAYPGPYNVFTKSFHLTAFKNPGNYNLSFDSTRDGFPIKNNAASQVLDGSNQTRVLLKSCMEKCILVKLPVGGDPLDGISGQINALGEEEADLMAGDLIYVKMSFPRTNGVDIYCNSQSLKVQGVGEPPY